MKRIVFMLFLCMMTLVLTTKPLTAFASEEDEYFPSCVLSYVDVFCAENPEKCLENSALNRTSVHAEFAFLSPHRTPVRVLNAPQASTILHATTSSSMQTSGMDSERLFQLVNSYRISVGLSAFQKHPDLCAVAASRGPELQGEIQNGNIHGGMYRRNLPYWVTENMKWGGNEEEVLSWWLGSPVHSSAIHGDYTYACTQCTGQVCIMLFTSFVPKNTGGQLTVSK